MRISFKVMALRLWAAVMLLTSLFSSSSRADIMYVSARGDSGISMFDLATGSYTATLAMGLNSPSGLTLDMEGNLYVANTLNGVINRITPQGVVTTYATLSTGITSLAMDSSGNLFVTNPYTESISKVTPDGQTSTFVTFEKDNRPRYLAFDPEGNLVTSVGYFVANPSIPNSWEQNHSRVEKITPDGTVTTLFTSSTQIAYHGVAVDAAGNVFVVQASTGYLEPAGWSVKKITPQGEASTFVPLEQLFYPPIGFGSDGLLYGYNGQMQKVTPEGEVSPSGGPRGGGNINGFAIWAVPEPSSAAFVGVGLVTLFAGRRRARLQSRP